MRCAGIVGAYGDHYLACHVRLNTYGGAILVQVRAQGVARLAQGLTLHIKNGNLLG